MANEERQQGAEASFSFLIHPYLCCGPTSSAKQCLRYRSMLTSVKAFQVRMGPFVPSWGFGEPLAQDLKESPLQLIKWVAAKGET